MFRHFDRAPACARRMVRHRTIAYTALPQCHVVKIVGDYNAVDLIVAFCMNSEHLA